MVDSKMRELSANADLKPMKLSVLTAVNICDEYLKAKESLGQLTDELEKLKEENVALQLEKNTLEEEKKFLKDEIRGYRKNGGK